MTERLEKKIERFLIRVAKGEASLEAFWHIVETGCAFHIVDQVTLYSIF